MFEAIRKIGIVDGICSLFFHIILAKKVYSIFIYNNLCCTSMVHRNIPTACKKCTKCNTALEKVEKKKAHNFTFVNKKIPEECFLADDIVISYYLHKHNVSVLNHGFINTFKHRKWQHDKTSVNSFHRKNKFSINRKCLRVLEETNKL